jgi:TonB family protein
MLAAIFLSIAMLLERSDDISEPLSKSLRDPNALTRSVAARVIAVRDVQRLLPELHGALLKELDPFAAREEIRAIGILGGANELDFLRAESKRFASAFDGDAVMAIARVDSAAAIDAYIDAVKREHAQWSVLPLALWGKPALVTPTAARVLGTHDESAWCSLIDAITGSDAFLNANLSLVALNNRSDVIAEKTALYLARVFLRHPPVDAAPILAALDESRSGAPPSLILARELLGRVLGRAPREHEATTKWLHSERNGNFPSDLRPILTRAEELALEPGLPPKPVPAQMVSETPLDLAVDLPPGMAAAVMHETACGRDAWAGLARVAVDEHGRVTDADVSKVTATKPCKRALNVLLRASLAENRNVTSARHTDQLLLVHSFGAPLCMEEPADGLVGVRPVGGAIRMPKTKKQPLPRYPEGGARIAQAFVNVDVRVSRGGCVAAVRLLQQSPLSAFNTNALLALSAWTFEPATLDGRKTSVVYDLPIYFRPR